MDDEQFDLSPRQQTILNLIVHTYVATAAPVSSKALLESAGINVSSATIRNEMAALEELGFLTHRHTSAGRIPTDKGYRYFVERLLGDVELPIDEKNTIRHQFHQAKLEVAQWMQLAAVVLARSARAVALVSAPQLDQPKVRHIELISTQSHLALLILVFQGGTVRQSVLTLKDPMSQQVLSQTATMLNSKYVGLDAQGIRSKLSDPADLEIDVMNLVLELMADGAPPSQDVYREGLTEVLRQPEFTSQTDARALVDAMEEPGFLRHVLISRVGTVQVVIGGEGRWRELSSCSMVLARYGVEGFATGTLGVLGPTRMPYGRAISAVRYVADLMSDLVSDLYAE
jgi:heat-inducible transcriptional repressor